MSQQIGPGKDLIAAHMIDVMMRVQDSFHVCVVVSDVSCHVLRHLREGHGVDDKGSPLFQHKRGVRDAYFAWPWTTV